MSYYYQPTGMMQPHSIPSDKPGIYGASPAAVAAGSSPLVASSLPGTMAFHQGTPLRPTALPAQGPVGRALPAQGPVGGALPVQTSVLPHGASAIPAASMAAYSPATAMYAVSQPMPTAPGYGAPSTIYQPSTLPYAQQTPSLQPNGIVYSANPYLGQGASVPTRPSSAYTGARIVTTSTPAYPSPSAYGFNAAVSSNPAYPAARPAAMYPAGAVPVGTSAYPAVNAGQARPVAYHPGGPPYVSGSLM